jgi:hypothetical protein
MANMNIKIDFQEDGHIYTYNGKQADYSITQVLKEVGLTKNMYKDVDFEVLKAAAKRGSLYHKDLENVIKDRNYMPMTEQGMIYREWMNKEVDSGVAEVIIGMEYKSKIICGTVDDMLILKNGEYTLDDHKFNAEFHREAATYQTALAKYILKKVCLQGGYSINGRDYAGFIVAKPKSYCDFFKTGQSDFKRIELAEIEDTEIERMLDCLLNKVPFVPANPVIEIGDTTADILIQKEIMLAEYELKAKELKAEIEETRNLIKDTLIKNKRSTWTSPKGIVKYNLVDTKTYWRLDTTKMKNQNPEGYARLMKEYGTQITQNAYIKATVDKDKYDLLKKLDNEAKAVLENESNNS